ncbi:ABC transporter ATP-binding protein [Aeromicrobium sp. Marseille-Q0843]|uniref:ABC transporter ATP-binding protein n=1 Tax=Aeromicrobium phoceense TaxID=2754045 RepID=A0A838XPB3_9ACTN|nr:ABC transporter ATP-binding protein [Aeromicrobium phoceense]MBA4608700.1 ABC transporter ATP-binding protein [Aeromicrobium phoceense]
MEVPDADLDPQDEATFRLGQHALVRHHLASIFRSRRGPLTLALALGVAGSAVSLAQPYLLKRILDSLHEPEALRLVLVLAGVALVAACFDAIQQFVVSREAERLVADLRLSLVQKSVRLRMPAYSDARIGDLVTRLTTDASMVRGVLAGGVLDVPGNALVLVGALTMMVVLDPVLSLIVLLGTVVALVSATLASRQIRSQAIVVQQSVGTLGAEYERSVSGIQTVRAWGQEQQLVARMSALIGDARKRGTRIAGVESVLWPVTGLVMHGCIIAVVAVGGSRVELGEISVSDLAAFMLLTFMVIAPFNQLVGTVLELQVAGAALLRLAQIERLPDESDLDSRSTRNASPRESITHPPRASDRAVGPRLVLGSVDFTYGDQLALDGISFDAGPGGVTALVGPSGSGKSTILALLMRFVDPSRGRITMDGEDIADLDPAAVRSQIAFVGQNAEILAGTVRQNLTLGQRTDSVERERTWEVLTRLGLGARLRSANGLDTAVGEHGLQLSGGEKQRLVVARALLSDRPVVLLDEPTSGVDATNEAEILSALAEVPGKTCILVTHRPMAMSSAEKIVLIDAGRVVSVGTHEELLRSDDLYARLNERSSGPRELARRMDAPRSSL